MKRLGLAVTLAVTLGAMPFRDAWAQTHTAFVNGDVFVATGNGQVQWRLPDGSLNATLTSTVAAAGFTTGMAFDSLNRLYVTAFSANAIALFDSTGTELAAFATGLNASPESVLFDRGGNVFVGQAGGSGDVLKFDSAGTLLTSFNVPTEDRGSDWIDLARDQCTLFYTSEGQFVHRFDVCANAALSDFTTNALPGGVAYALRILPSGGVLVADSTMIVRLDATGNVIQTYDAPGEDSWFALNLDPNGTSFWSADFTTADIFKFDIATGNIQTTFNSGTGAGTVFGITVKGEITAALLEPAPRVCTPITQLATHGGCITRNARFWFTRPETNDSDCVTLKRAIDNSGGELCIGFQTLPVEYENADNVKDAEDALIEALGLYWRNQKRTGEDRGRQTLHLPASPLCRARKQLAVELIAAIANNAVLGTAPANCTYETGAGLTNFPSDLIEQAGSAARGEDLTAARTFTALLRKFNNSGLTNDFVGGMVECSESKPSALRKLSRDPTTRFSCPGLNDDALSAEALTSFPVTKTVNLSRYNDDFSNPACGIGGQDAVWKLTPTVAVAGRNFIIDTFGSNFDTLLSVWQQGSGGGVTPVACSDDENGTQQSQIIFPVDGTSTYFIVAEGKQGAIGTLKLRVRSF